MKTERLYEQVKKTLRTQLVESGFPQSGDWNDNFILVCPNCGLAFRNDVEVGMVAAHAETAHEIDVEASKMKLNLVWIGIGPPPVPREERSR